MCGNTTPHVHDVWVLNEVGAAVARFVIPHTAEGLLMLERLWLAIDQPRDQSLPCEVEGPGSA